jgi:hypothetical protein
MNKWMRLIATSTASVALAGTALLGATGSASAASRPAGQDRQDVSAGAAAWDRSPEHGYGDALRGGNDHRWDSERTWHPYSNGYQRVEYWRGDDGHLYRYDGHRLAKWVHGHWVTVRQSHGHGPVR